MEKTTYKITSPKKMESLGKRIARSLSGGDVILLNGELGAGKTVLCKGIAKGLKIKSQVVSPTFTIMNEYFGTHKFCHFDAYRLESADEAAEAGLTDFIGADGTICAVEWWSNVKELFIGLRTIEITINKIGEKVREVSIER